MATVAKVTTIWSGFKGAPGYTKMAFNNVADVATANAAVTDVHTFFTALVSEYQTGWRWDVQPLVELFDVATGALTGEIGSTANVATINGTASNLSAYNGGTGVTIVWKSTVIFSGRRVRGRTYLVPLVNVADTDGTLPSTTIGTIQAAANALIASSASDFCIHAHSWSKDPKPVITGGTTASVATGVIADRTGILRSRRD